MVVIDINKCTKCELCVKSCVTGAIKPTEGLVYNDFCMGCSHCVAVCPKDAVSQSNLTGDYITDHNISPENFENLIYTRKSIRNFKKDEIKEKTLNDFLNLMQYAPTGTNSQQTYITVLKNREKITSFSEQIISFFKKTMKLAFTPLTYPFMRIFIGKEKTNKLFSYKNMLLNLEEGKDIITYNCPVVVVFHASPDSSTPDMDCNIQASYASLHAITLGLGTCFNGFITRGLNGNKKLKKEIGIPKSHKVYSSLLVGYPELNYKKRVIRNELKINIVS